LVACAQSQSKLEPLLTEQKQEFGLKWVYVDSFNLEEKKKLEIWITEIYDVTSKTIGPYPFDVSIHFFRSEKGNPVSFGLAKALEAGRQAHFYVNPTASLGDLLADWIAPHELSHLSIPFLEKKDKWFTEGFATFLSRQLLMEMGYYTPASFDSLYTSRIHEDSKHYTSTTLKFPEVSDSLFANHIYGPVYWCGASYFYSLDKRMRAEKNKRFVDLIKEYQLCCRETKESLNEMVVSLDKILNETWCQDLLKFYQDSAAKTVMDTFNENYITGN
jgi:hypothetical protein